MQLKKQGLDLKSYKENIKKQLEQIQLLNFEVKSKIVIRDEKVKKYYNKHTDKFMNKEKVHLATIVLIKDKSPGVDNTAFARSKAEELFIRLENGENFSELAEKYSQGPGAKDGGDIGFFETSQLNPKLIKAINNISSGEVSRPIETGQALQIVKLLERQEGKQKPLEEVKPFIYGILFREEVNKRYTFWLKELRQKAYTKIYF